MDKICLYNCSFRILLDFPRTRYGGGTGIRTLETLSRLTVFKTAAFNHSAIPPRAGLKTRDYVPSLWLDDLPAVHIGAEGVWDVDRAVGLLVVLKNGEQGASNREA